MATQFRLIDRLRRSTLCGRSVFRLYSAEAARANPYYQVPAGHKNSDLSNTVCHIGLGRLRDLTLRQDLSLITSNGPQSLKAVFKGKRVVLFGVPDMGKVCSEKHVPSYTKAAAALKDVGVRKVVCVAVSSPQQVASWAAQVGIDGKTVESAADPSASFTRGLGLETGPPDAPGPKSHRYAALVDDGILLKLKVESNPGDVTVSSAESMVQVIKAYYEL